MSENKTEILRNPNTQSINLPAHSCNHPLWRKDLAKECKQITTFMSSKNSNNSLCRPVKSLQILI